MLLLADDEPRLLAPELQVLRDEADRRERKDLGVVADLGPAVDDRRRADPAVRRRSGRAAPIDGVRTDGRALADLRPTDATIAVGSISVRVGDQPEQQLALGDDLIADDTPPPARAASDARRRPSETSSRSRSPGTTCRRNFASLTPRR